MHVGKRIGWVVLLLACPGWAAAGDKAGKLTATVEKKDLPVDIEVPGVFKAEDKAELSVEPEEFSGTLTFTKIIPAGTSVKEGDILAKFDRQDLKKAINNAEQALVDANFKLEKARSEIKSKQIEDGASQEKVRKELGIAQRKLEAGERSRRIKLDELEKGVRDAENELADAQVNLEQLAVLYKNRELHLTTENILMQREERGLKEKEQALQHSRLRLEQAEQCDLANERQELELAVLQKKADLEKLAVQSQIAAAEKQVDVTKAEKGVTQAQGTLDALKQDQEKLTVKSPREGVVFYGSIGQENPVGLMMANRDLEVFRVGGRAVAHQKLFTVASMENLSVTMKVLENDIQHMKPGLPVTLHPDAFPDLSIEGKLTEVSQIATQGGSVFSQVREFTVKAVYEGVSPRLRAGMNCRVTVHADRVADAVQVPVAAVFEEEGKHYCFVEEAGKPVRRGLNVGLSNGKAVQVLEGVKPGESVYLYDPTRE